MSASEAHVLTAAGPRPTDAEIDIFGLTHPGRVRPTNQDHFLICSVRKQVQVHQTSLPQATPLPLAGERMAFLACVADGVGGGSGGEAASRLVLERITEYVTLTMRAYHDLEKGTDAVAYINAGLPVGSFLRRDRARRRIGELVNECVGEPET